MHTKNKNVFQFLLSLFNHIHNTLSIRNKLQVTFNKLINNIELINSQQVINLNNKPNSNKQIQYITQSITNELN